MIERVLYGRQLPALYEVNLSAGRGSDKPLVYFADQLEVLGDSREESLYLAVMDKSQDEGIDVDYSLRLMRPDETKKYIRTMARKALAEVLTKRVLNITPYRQIGDWALSGTTQLIALERQGASTK